MAAFSSSYQYHPFLFDSALILSNNNINTTTAPVSSSSSPLSQLYLHPHHHHHEASFNNNNNNVTNNKYNQQDQTVTVSCVDQSSKASIISDNEPSVTKNLSPQSSMVVDKLETGDEQVTQKVMTPMERKRRIRDGSSFNNPQSNKDGTEERSKKMRNSNNNNNGGGVKKEEEKGKKAEKKKKGSDEEPPTGYIHVRARRGQATDSHSLAERVRREKISERMKMLQRLVPGCDKVTGKALMLDEIINYVQSLQNQVEFLSMKLASVNPMFYDLASDIDTFLVRPEKLNNNSITSPSPAPAPAISVAPHCSTTFADTTTATTIFPQTNDYVLDSSASIFLQQGQRSNNVFSEDSGSHFWDAEEQRQKFLHPYGFINNNLCSFH